MEMNQTLSVPVSQVSDVERAEFIKKTYLHLAVSVLAFVGLEALLLSIPAVVSFGMAMTQGMTWLLVLGAFMFATSAAESWAHKSTNKTAQYAALAICVIAQAIIFIPLMFVASQYSGGNLIGQAGLITTALFAGLTAVALTTKKDFSFMRTGLMVGGFVAMGLIVASILFGFSLGLWFSVAMVALAAGSILYQTSKMVHNYNTDQYVAASLGLFASFMLLLWYVLRILMSFASSD